MARLPKGIYIRPNQKGYYAYVKLEEVNEKGENKRYPVYGKSVAEVQQKRKEVQLAVANGTFINKREKKKKIIEEQREQELQSLYEKQKSELQKKLESEDPAEMTLGEWYEIWLTQYKGRTLKGYTLSTYKGYLRNYLMVKSDPSRPATDKVNRIASYQLGNCKLKNISGLLLQLFFNTCVEIGLNPKSIHNIEGAISECFAKGVTLGIIPVNPAMSVELPKVKKAEREVLNLDEIKRMLNLMHNDHEPRENCVGVITCIGLRISEALGLSWDNVDFEKRTITICQQLQRRKHTEDAETVYTLIPSTKNGKSRTIYAPDICFEYLSAEKKKQELWEKEVGDCYFNRYNLCFTNQDGSNISQMSITKCVKKYCTMIGKPNIRVHDLRHSFATLITANPNIPIATASAILGHSTTSFTLNTYVHDRDADKKESQNQITEVFKDCISFD